MRERVARQKPIPHRYVPKRVVSMAKGGDLKHEQVYAAAMFCYFEEHQWLLDAGIGTNFPRGHKVQSSMKTAVAKRVGRSVKKPDCYDILRAGLIDGITFPDLALRANFTASPRTMHRYGRELLRSSLTLFARQLDD